MYSNSWQPDQNTGGVAIFVVLALLHWNLSPSHELDLNSVAFPPTLSSLPTQFILHSIRLLNAILLSSMHSWRSCIDFLFQGVFLHKICPTVFCKAISTSLCHICVFWTKSKQPIARSNRLFSLVSWNTRPVSAKEMYSLIGNPLSLWGWQSGCESYCCLGWDWIQNLLCAGNGKLNEELERNAWKTDVDI